MASVSIPPASGRRIESGSLISSRRALPWRGLPIFGAFPSATVAFQVAAGCYRSEFDGYPDEPAHYITGLMVHDYIASGSPFHRSSQENPLHYAENYYLHYPKVSFGHWPPVFYLLQAAWTLLFSISRTSLLLLMAVTTAGVAELLFLAARKNFGFFLSAGLSFLWILTPFVQANTGMVMAESLVAPTSLLAALSLGRYMDREAPRDALWFGVWTLLCILTRRAMVGLEVGSCAGNCADPEMVLTAKARALWCGSDRRLGHSLRQLMTLSMVKEGWEDRPGLFYTFRALGSFLAMLAGGIGWIAFGFVLLGAAVLCLLPVLRGRPVPASGRSCSPQPRPACCSTRRSRRASRAAASSPSYRSCFCWREAASHG